MLDADTGQPLAFTVGSAARTVGQATPELLEMAAGILNPQDTRPLVMADTEHFCASLFEHVAQDTPFDLLTPMPARKGLGTAMAKLPADAFTPRWAGFATASVPYHLNTAPDLPLHQIVQRCAENSEDYQFKAFLSTRNTHEVALLTEHYPKRWHVEEFFNANQALGWKRAGTLNLNIRYGQMTLALMAQAAIHQLRIRLGEPFAHWDAPHLARHLFQGLDGDIRVSDDTVHVTYYNAPNAQILREHYERLPHKLTQENIDPHVPWLYNLKLDFHFR